MGFVFERQIEDSSRLRCDQWPDIGWFCRGGAGQDGRGFKGSVVLAAARSQEEDGMGGVFGSTPRYMPIHLCPAWLQLKPSTSLFSFDMGFPNRVWKESSSIGGKTLKHHFGSALLSDERLS